MDTWRKARGGPETAKQSSQAASVQKQRKGLWGGMGCGGGGMGVGEASQVAVEVCWCLHGLVFVSQASWARTAGAFGGLWPKGEEPEALLSPEFLTT